MRYLSAAALLLACTSFVSAQQAPIPAAPAPAPQKDVGYSLTIYSSADPGTFSPQDFAAQQRANPYNVFKLPGYGVVREVRKIDLVAGENIIRFTDVASGIDPTTVAFKSLTAPNSTAVLEQNYEFDLTSADKLLQKYLDKQIVLVRKTAQAGQSGPAETVEGTLLSFDASSFVLQTEDKQQPTIIIPRSADITSIRLAKLDTGLITKPTLVWKLTADKAEKHDAQVTYQTDGLTWRSDYNFVINKDDTALDAGAWVTILNESGASYPQANLKLVAGDVQRINPVQQVYAAPRAAARGGMGGGGGFAEKSFFEYHLYTLGRPTSLPNKSTKQIELFPTRTNVPVTKTYVYYGVPEQFRIYYPGNTYTDRTVGTESNKKVDTYIAFKNSEQNGMGMPLPAGRIRVYKKDEADGNMEFIGEDLIQHTPKDEQVLVKLGSAFDVVGERKQTDFNINVNGHVITESFEIAVRNHKKEAITVIVKENLYRALNWEITKSSDKYEKQDSRTIHFPLQVQPDGETKMTYTVTYTW